MSLMRTCTKCFLQKPIEEFLWKNKLLRKRHTVCKECTAKGSNDWYQENKDSHIRSVMTNKNTDRERARRMEYRVSLLMNFLDPLTTVV